MEGTLRVTPEQLETTSGEFSEKGAKMSDLTTQMMSLVDGLSSIWEGAAATSYRTQGKQLEDDIQKLARMVQEHASDLGEMARIYREAENANQSDASALPGDVVS